MKKLLTLLLSFLVLFSFFTTSVNAQYQDLTKNYCETIKNVSTTYNDNGLISMSNTPQAPSGSGSWNVVINSVTVTKSGSTTSQTFDINQSFTTTQIANGPKFVVPPSFADFMKSQTKDDSGGIPFGITINEKIMYPQGDPGTIADPVKDFNKGLTPCTTKGAIQYQAQQQTQTQTQTQPNANVGAGNAAVPPAGNGGTPDIWCDDTTPRHTHINTGIGCIPITGSEDFVGWFLGWAIGVAGGIALLLIVIAGFNIMTASGDPQKLNNGRELLTAAISGLILIIFSVFLLRLIGVQILQIPGLI